MILFGSLFLGLLVPGFYWLWHFIRFAIKKSKWALLDPINVVIALIVLNPTFAYAYWRLFHLSGLLKLLAVKQLLRSLEELEKHEPEQPSPYRADFIECSVFATKKLFKVE